MSHRRVAEALLLRRVHGRIEGISRPMPQPPAWLSGLADVAAKAMEPLDSELPARLGCHYTKFEGVWEVTLFIESTEIIGGPEDGSIKQAPLGVRICDILNVFQSVNQCNWQTQRFGADDDLGSHLSVEGTYKGRLVWLRILAQAPHQFPARRVSRRNRLINDDAW
jgi:hypothetical protein